MVVPTERDAVPLSVFNLACSRITKSAISFGTALSNQFVINVIFAIKD